MEQLALVCIDNIECVAGDEPWEMAIFNLYNRILESGKTRLLITGDRPPRQLNLGLPDLASRLDWGQIYKLQPLSDEDKLQALQLRARLRGFEMPEDVCRFLLKRLDREMRSLFMTLDQLDHASITAQRKLTIPFVKEILSFSPPGSQLLLRQPGQPGDQVARKAAVQHSDSDALRLFFPSFLTALRQAPLQPLLFQIFRNRHQRLLMLRRT